MQKLSVCVCISVLNYTTQHRTVQIIFVQTILSLLSIGVETKDLIVKLPDGWN